MSEEPESFLSKAIASVVQFMKFGIIGGSGVLVNLVVALIMNHLNGGSTNYNKVVVQLTERYALRFNVLVWICGFLVANIWNFQLNRSWTFKRERARGWWKEFAPFFLVGSVAAAIGALIIILLTNPTSPFYLPSPLFNDHEVIRARAYWAQFFTIMLTMPINYVVNRIWTFRAVKETVPEGESAR